MNDDATAFAPSPLGVRVFRTTVCFVVAAALAWYGHSYDDPMSKSVVPYLMCELTAAVLGLLGLLNLDGNREPGPA